MPPAKKAAAAATIKKAAASAKRVAPVKKAAAVRKTAPKKAAVQKTITLKQIAAQIADSHDVSKKHAGALLGGLVAATVEHLKNGDEIRLTGLGILQVRALQARMGRNPATSEEIKIKASKKIVFRAGKELKEAV